MAADPSTLPTDKRLYRLTRRSNADGLPVVDLDFSGMHRGQAQAWYSPQRIVAVISGTQGGKTSFGPWWLWREIYTHGPGDYLAVTATFDLFKMKMLPALRETFEDALGIARYWAGDGVLEICQHQRDEKSGLWVPVRDASGQYVFGAKRAADVNRMWGRIIMRSASAEGGLESATAKAAWLDEAGQDEFTLGAYEAVLRRLSIHRGRILITTTPYNLGWLKQQVYDRWKAGDKQIALIQFSSLSNPSFPREEFEERRRTMDDWKFRMFYLGQFERPAGLIYNAFLDRYREQGGHKVKAFLPPSTWPRWVGIDPGAVHQGTIWLAHDPAEDVFYLYRESLAGDKSTAEHAHEAKTLVSVHRERVIRWFIGNKSERQQRKDWRAAGITNVAEPPVGDVEAGIDRVIQLLKEHRLYITDDCTGVLDEIGSYRRKLDENDQPTEVIKNKERFHRLDALRYVVVGVTHKTTATRGAGPEGLSSYRG